MGECVQVAQSLLTETSQGDWKMSYFSLCWHEPRDSVKVYPNYLAKIEVIEHSLGHPAKAYHFSCLISSRRQKEKNP